jgi:hypothetical protein
MKIKATATIEIPKDKCCVNCKYLTWFENTDWCYFFSKIINCHKPCRPCLNARKEAESGRVN